MFHVSTTPRHSQHPRDTSYSLDQHDVSWHEPHASLQTHIHHRNRLRRNKTLDSAPVLLSGDTVDLYLMHSGAVVLLLTHLYNRTSTELRKNEG